MQLSKPKPLVDHKLAKPKSLSYSGTTAVLLGFRSLCTAVELLAWKISQTPMNGVRLGDHWQSILADCYTENIQERLSAFLLNYQEQNLLNFSHEYEMKSHMDKLQLYRAQDNSFRIRLHFFHFEGRSLTNGMTSTIHSHSWNFSSLVLAGSFRERIFEGDPQGNTAPKLIEETIRDAGEVYSLSAGTFHQTLRAEDEEFAATLFIRGRPEVTPRWVWDEVAQRYLAETSKAGMLHLRTKALVRAVKNQQHPN